MSIMLDRIVSLINGKYQSDKDFENDFGISRSTVSAWKKGKLKSYEKMAPKIADFFNVSLDWLSGNEQKNKPSAEAEDYSEEAKRLLGLIEQLTPANRAKLEELCRLYLADQGKKK